MMQAVVNVQKQNLVTKLAKLLDEHPIIGIVDVESLPGKNLASMRKNLRGTCTILMTKKRLMRIAFKKSKKDLAALEPHLKGMPALLFTSDNPFNLFKTLKKNQSPAPIKPGQVAPSDLVVPAGPTPFQPGPIISELGQLGIKSGVEDGKVVIKEDATLAKADDVVDEKIAGFLAKMGIEPMRIGLKLVAVWENDEVLTGDVLDIDEEAFMADLQAAAVAAQNLSVNTAFPTKDTISTLLQKAHLDAASLALHANIVTDVNVQEILAKAHTHAVSVGKHLPENKAEETKEEKQPEEKPKEKEPTEEKSDIATGLGSLFG